MVNYINKAFVCHEKLAFYLHTEKNAIGQPVNGSVTNCFCKFLSMNFLKMSRIERVFSSYVFDRNGTDTVRKKIESEIDDLDSIFANQWTHINRQSYQWYSIVFNVGAVHTAHFANVPILLDWLSN